MLEWITKNYGHVLHYGTFTFREWAEQVERVYSLDNAKNREAYKYLYNTSGLATKNNDCVVSVVK